MAGFLRAPRPAPKSRPMSLLRALPAILLGLAACKSRGAPQREGPAPLSPDMAARVEAEAQARLRALFPEVEGPLSRDSILAAVLSAEGLSAFDAPVRAAAIDALRHGDDEGARALLAELSAGRVAETARARRAAGDLTGSLEAWNRALDIAPASTALRCERAETALAAGLERDSTELLEAALADHLESARRAPSARAWLGASRAARALGQRAAALEHARRGWELLRATPARERPALPEPAERTLAAAAWDAWSAAQPSASPESTAETRAALEALVGLRPEEPWAWERLAEFHRLQGADARARTVALAGLRILPREPALHAALAQSTRTLGGREAVVATFENIEAHDPADPQAAWQPAAERFARGIEALRAGLRHAAESFLEAERGFLRAAELDRGRRLEARALAARCQVGAALDHLSSGELGAARAALLRAEERAVEVLAQPLAEDLPSGIAALRRIAETWRERGGDPSRADAPACLAEAADCYADLHRLAPGDAAAAAQAATLAREAARALEVRARLAAGRQQWTDAHASMARARALMEASYAAASEAARLRPEDAAALRAPGEVLVHYLQRDVPQAESWLRSAARLWEAEVARLRAAMAAPALPAPEAEALRRKLEEAESGLGDAYQDLGVLHLSLKGDAHNARGWFERALATGPDPREDVRGPGGWLARCDEALKRGTDPKLTPEKRWGALPAETGTPPADGRAQGSTERR